MFSKSSHDRIHVAPVLLNSDPLPWVTQVKYVGNVLENDKSMKIDCTLRRGKFVWKANSLFQEFHFVKYEVFIPPVSMVRTVGPLF